MLQKLELPKGFQRNVLKMEGQGSGVVGDRRGGFVRRGIEMKQDPMALVSCVLHLCFVCGKKKKKFAMYKFNQRNEKMEKQRQKLSNRTKQ